MALTFQIKGMTVSEGKWRWVEYTVCARNFFVLFEWLVFSLVAPDSCIDTKGDFLFGF